MRTPIPEPARRLEIFTGAGRRRLWPAEEKAAILAECEREGETVCGVARRHGLTASQLFWWRRQAREAGRSANQRKKQRGAMFAPVVVEAEHRATVGDCGIEIVIGAAVVRLRGGFDARTLAAVFAALKGCP